MNYEIKIENYQGPLDKLLELVEEKKLDISLISLAKVTEGFLNYLKEMQESKVPYTILADFLVIASKLLLIKSKVLIPTIELEESEEEDIKNLELQLKIYRQIKAICEHIKSNWDVYPQMASRDFLMGKKSFFYPPNLKPADLLQVIEGVAQEIEKFKPVETIKVEMINLQEKMEEIMNRIKKSPVKLGQIIKSGTKEEIIAAFLAILHLLKKELIEVSQARHFSEISIVKKNKIN